MLNNVLCYLEKSAELNPLKIAFTDEKSEISFGELLRRSKALGCIIAKKLGKDVFRAPIAVVADRSVQSVVCFMGVLYAGCFYVPIDGDMPVSRATVLMENLAPSLVLCKPEKTDYAKAVCGNAQILEYSESELDFVPDMTFLDEIRRNVIDTDPVYVIHTSGSTGVPKGIVISHKSVIDFIEWMTEEIGFDSDDVFANQAPFFFDLSVKDLYLTLKHGATNHIIPKKMFMFPSMLVDFIQSRGVTSLTWATSAFNLVAASGILDKKKPTSLKKVVLGGEALWGKNLNAWARNLPDVKYVNLYGPTEVTVDCTCYIVDRAFADSEAVPIGRACKNKQIMLLDENLKRVEDGMSGEICVRGTGLALGYYNNPEKTSQAFVQNPEISAYRDIIYRTGDIGVIDGDGNIVFKSRKDGQIKHMGYRIELGEIERALSGCRKIDSAVCVYDENKRRIVAFYQAKDEIKKEEIASELTKSIPKYMLPNIYTYLEKMPMTNGGKIDRVALKGLLSENKK